MDIAYSLDERFRFSLFDLGDLIDDLEAKLHRKVDLVNFDAMSPFLKESILKDMIYIFNETIFILDDSFRIKQIRKAISKINRLMDQFENYETYLNKDLMQDTFIKNIELVGEYVYRMTNEVKNSFLEIPWGKIEKCVIYWSINTMTFI